MAFAVERARPAGWRAPEGTVVIGPDYGAGALHRWLRGTDYRALWTTPARVETLDLGGVAAGLTPLARVGGRETKGLALRGADGRDYTFRAIDKDPTEVLPEELQETWVRNLVQDQIAANHPAAFLVVDELTDAAGILHPKTDTGRVYLEGEESNDWHNGYGGGLWPGSIAPPSLPHRSRGVRAKRLLRPCGFSF
jgi:hypothetical protein